MAEKTLNKTTTEYLIQMDGTQELLIESQSSQSELLTKQTQRIESYGRLVSEQRAEAAYEEI